MRIKDIIVESNSHDHPTHFKRLNDGVGAALPGVWAQPQLQNNDAYRQYRYSLAVAASSAEQEHDGYSKETAWGENLIQVAYTDADREIIEKASKLFGVTPVQIADTRSHEADDTGTISPVLANSGRNKKR